MKIYEIGTGYTPIPAQMGAATEIVVEELTRSFIKNGEKAEIIDIKAEKRAETELPIIEVNVPKMFTKTDVSLGIMHKLKRVVYSISLAKKLKKILKKTDEKVVLHFHNQYNLFFFLKLTSKKLLKKAVIAYTVHSYIWHGEWDEITETIAKRYFQEVYCLKFADLVFVLNDKTKNNVIEHCGIDSRKVFLIDNGVNTHMYKPLSQSEKDKAKSNYNLLEKTVFVQVGSVCERKNQLTAVKLLAPIMKQNKNIVFCYAGGIISPEYQASIKEFAKINGIEKQVIYLGELCPGEQLNEIYNMAETMIFPSKAEGFSLVIIEAMSAGLPVVIHSSLQFELAESCIRYTNENDACEIIIDKILNPEIKKGLSEISRKVVEETYSWDKVAKDYKAMYDKFL